MSGETYSLILALTTALAAGLIGSFALMRRVILAGDVISHVALPGIGLAILYGVNPVLGGATTLLLGTALIWSLEKRTGLTTETIIGVIFAASLAIGALLIGESEELVDALFGEFAAISSAEFFIGLLGALAVIAFVWLFKERLILSIFSPELAAATSVNLDRLNLYFLLAFSLTVILGVRFLGALLMGSLIIIPAAIGRQLTHTLSRFLVVSAVASVAAVAAGFYIRLVYNLEADQLGPLVITVASVIFGLSLFKKKK